MRTFSILGSALALLMLASVATAAPLPLPRWEIEYDLVGSTFQITGTPFGLGDGNFALWGKGTNPNIGEGEEGISPGNMSLEFTDCAGAICVGAGNTPARLGLFHLEQHFNVSGVFSDLVTDMQGEALGNYDGGLVVNWTTPATDWHVEGDVNCLMAYCSLGGLADGSNPQNNTSDETIGAFNFNINTANVFDIFSDWETAAENTSSQTFFHIRGVETSRSLVVPEPGTAMLLGLGLLGLALKARKTS